MSSLSKCNSFKSEASFLSLKFEPVWHISDCCENELPMLSAAILNHFREYLEFFEISSAFSSLILFEYVVWTFFWVFFKHVSLLISWTFLHLMIHIACKVLPKIHAYVIFWERNKWLLMFLTWNSLFQGFFNIFLYPIF